MNLLDRVEPDCVQFRVAGDDVRLDVLRDRLIDVALRELPVRPACAVTHQFVRQAARHAREDEVPHRVFENGAVADFLDVVR